MLMVGADDKWESAPTFEGVRDPAVAARDLVASSNHSAVIAFCDEIRMYSLPEARTAPVFSRSNARTDCDRKLDPGPIDNWDSTIGIPQALDVVDRGGDGSVIYVADTKATLDATTVRFGISVIDPKDGAIAPLPGADLTSLHAAPVDVAVSERGNVCIATAGADRMGPLMVVIDGALRRIDTGTHQVTGCGWNGASIVAATTDGEILKYDDPSFDTESGVFVP